MRVAIKVLVTVYGLALFGAFQRGGQMLALRRTSYSLWCFFGATLWSNFISVCFVPFNFKESLQTARRIQAEQEAEAGARPLSTQHSQAQASRYGHFAHRTISSGYLVESPEDFRRAGAASYHSEQEGEDDDPYAATTTSIA